MGKPSLCLHAACLPFVPRFLCKQEAASALVVVKNLLHLMRCLTIQDNDILLVVKTKAAGIEVCTANGAELSVNADDLGMMETAFKNPNRYTLLHEFVRIVEATVGS